MATNTQEWINLYLASDWRDWILEEKASQRSHNNSKSNNFGGGNLEMYFV